jgi:quercetin dioxygenase-like cupin family protein
MARSAIAALLGAALGAVAISGAAQQAPVPAPAPNPGAARFTGKQTMLESGGSETIRVARGRFEAGTRSYWHSHDNGQLIFVQEGRGRVQRRGEAVKEIGLHESDYTEPKVVHWHGAAPDQHAVFATVAFGGATQWLDEVPEDQYLGKRR